MRFTPSERETMQDMMFLLRTKGSSMDTARIEWELHEMMLKYGGYQTNKELEDEIAKYRA